MADKVFTARWVFPVSGPPLDRGALLVTNDRIVAVAKHGRFTPDMDLGNAAIVPGFVNAHTHLDLTGARGLTPPTQDFTVWLRSVIAYRRNRTAGETESDIYAGSKECLCNGTTLVGDIAANGLSLGSRCEQREVIFVELLGLSEQRASEAADFALQACSMFAVPARDQRLDVTIGISPHSPYSFNCGVLQRVATQSKKLGFPMAIHLAESSAELELLERHSGPFVPFLAELGAWDTSGLAWSPQHVIELTGDSVNILYVHCNFLSPTTEIPATGTIVYCPRTHAAFDHPPHPFREFLVRGVRVALGTDSLASNPDLSLLAEARFIASRYADFNRTTLLRMATLSGAEALGWSDVAGSFEPGKSADFAVVALPDRDDADPHELLFHSDLPVQQTWFRGERVFERT